MGKKVLMKGNEAIAAAAIRAGCRAYYGYPITPQSEIGEYMARHLPQHGGVFIQAESEVAAINMVYGSSAAGARVMTSSSGPGISLKQEGISFLAAAELPSVIVNIMRGGPGLGDIQPSQGDYFQATRGGGHGDYRTIVLAPSTVQEATDLTFLAFDLADQYRTPVMILGDGALGQMAEPVAFNARKKIELPPKDWILTGAKNREPRTIVPFSFDPEVIERINLDLDKKYQEIKRKEVRCELVNMQNPDIVVVAFGIMGRIIKTVIRQAKERKIEVGLIRPVTLWPFPSRTVYNAVRKFYRGKFLVVEMNLGQMVEDVELAAKGGAEVAFYGRAGGIIPTSEEVLGEIKKILRRR